MHEFLEREEFLSFCAAEDITERQTNAAKVRFSTKRVAKEQIVTGVSARKFLDIHWPELPDGTVHGLVESFYCREPRVKASSCTFIDGKIEGTYKSWKCTRKNLPRLQKEEIEFLHGVRHGYHTLWSKNNTLVSRRTFVEGRLLEGEYTLNDGSYRCHFLQKQRMKPGLVSVSRKRSMRKVNSALAFGLWKAYPLGLRKRDFLWQITSLKEKLLFLAHRKCGVPELHLILHNTHSEHL